MNKAKELRDARALETMLKTCLKAATDRRKRLEMFEPFKAPNKRNCKQQNESNFITSGNWRQENQAPVTKL